ncbi:nucleolar protein dao-5 [Lutzomyia longipalpis]|uniref:nucleolar protein dao-5 n=1 Tax=Lutzomyia longipalpis TaxID=7200 RepID=UPI00248387CF|nr:nucleolar protein dao-5 [Lutzomyia longipalpis]
MEDSVGNKENLIDTPRPRRSTRLAKSLMMQEGKENAAALGEKTTAKTPKKGTPRKTPKKALKESPTMKTPAKSTPKKTPKKTPAKSAGKSTLQMEDTVAPTTPRSARKSRSRSTLKELAVEEVVAQEESTASKNLFPEDVEKGKNLIDTFSKSLESIVDKPEDGTLTAEKEASNDPGKASPEKEKDCPMDVQSSSLKEVADAMEADDKLSDESCVIVNISDVSDHSAKEQDSKRMSIIVIPDTPMPTEEQVDRKLNETFSPEPAETLSKNLPKVKIDADAEADKTPKKVFPKTPKKTPTKLNLESTAGKMVNFAPLVASSALKSSILQDNKFLSPLKSIRKRSLSTNDVESSRKINHVTFHSPANMEITVDEIDNSMRPLIDEIRQERDAYVAAKAQEKKLAKRSKRSMSNVETGRNAPKHGTGVKTPTKKNFDFSLGKVPNFQAIHAASFKKMENLVDYKNRKEERAKNLLNASGKASTTPHPPQVSTSKNDESTTINPKGANILPVSAAENVETNIFAAASQSAEGENAATHVGISRPLNKIEERQQKWRSMHKTGTKSGTSQRNAAILKGVRTNRRFDLMMKFRDAQN